MIKRETDFLSALESNISILIKIARVYAYTTQDRKDLVNDIILELWKSYPKFKGDSKISTWIYRVSLNVALNTKRKRDNSKVLFFDELKVLDGSDILDIPNANSSEIGLLYQCIELLSDSSWVVNYKWDHYLKSNTKQISLWGKLVYSVFDENDHSQGIFLQYIEEKYFDYR